MWDKAKDIFGVDWGEVSSNERCSSCGQPDNCGDCNHVQLARQQVEPMKRLIPGLPRTSWDVV